MASFYDNASIITIPSGYKVGTLYSAKPTDGTGDMAFTRTGDTATRVNSAGIIERCITNLLLNSATLSTQSVTLTAQPYTLSIYGTGSVTLGGTGSGTLTGTGASNRVSLTFTPTAGSVSFTVAGSVTTAQLEVGDIATNYIATAGTAVTQGPVTNLPRLDYFGSTCPQLLMEPTRTNLETYSQMFDNSAWVKNTSSVSGNVLVSPDGYSNADVLIEDNTSGIHSVAKDLAFVSGTTYTFSCFVKQGSGTRRFAIATHGSAFGSTYVSNFNLQTGLVTNSAAQIVGKIENYGNGWYRCSAVATATATITRAITFFLRSTDTASSSSYTGDGTSSLFMWGAQVEAGAYATSYIPCTSATVTRNLDDCRKISITSLIGQTEGTMFVDFNKLSDSLPSTDPGYISLNANNTSTRIFLSYYGNTLSIQYRVNGTIIYANDFSMPLTRNKVAVGYKLNDLALYLNGTQIGTFAVTADFSTYNLTQFAFGVAVTNAQQFMAKTNQALVFKTRLTNAELATLTTL